MSDSESDAENEKNRRTKRSVVVKFQFEDSSSDDGDVAGPSNRNTHTKRCQKMVLGSSDESTSDSDTPLNLIQRKGGTKSKSQNCIESDESSDDSWSPVKKQESSSQSNATPPAIAVVSDNADSSDTDSSSCDSMEKCPICLHAFRDQEIGVPNVCEHSFCAPCIEEWSGNVQTCPIDRKPFSSIRIRSRYADGAFVREITVTEKSTEFKLDEADFTHCEICNRSDREDVMLLCDGCDAGYHMDCLMPPLTEIPEGSWYCDNCFASEESEDDITQVLAEMETFAAPETRLRVRREIVPRITRTRQNERIRTTIQNRRQENQRNTTVSTPGKPNRANQTVLFHILNQILSNFQDHHAAHKQ